MRSVKIVVPSFSHIITHAATAATSEPHTVEPVLSDQILEMLRLSFNPSDKLDRWPSVRVRVKPELKTT